MNLIRNVFASELRVYECETDGHAQHDDDGNMWIEIIKVWRGCRDAHEK